MNDDVFTKLSRMGLINALGKHESAESTIRVGLYTFLVGTNNSSFFFIDTCPIGEQLGSNGNGIWVATRDTSSQSCKLLVHWILKRLLNSRVGQSDTQSFAWLTEFHGKAGMSILTKIIFSSSICCNKYFVLYTSVQKLRSR